MLKKNALIIFALLIGITGFAQKKVIKKEETPSSFNAKEAETALLRVLNKLRVENKLDSVEYNEQLAKASEIQSADMAKRGKADLTNSKGKLGTTQKRVISNGTTKFNKVDSDFGSKGGLKKTNQIINLKI